MGKLREEHGQYPKHERHNNELKSYEWCLSNRIVIGPIPLWGDDYGSWTVQITMNGKTNTDPAKYEKISVMHKVYEYCDYYYNKYKKDGD